MTSNLNGGTQSDRVAECRHCPLDAITLTWRSSSKYLTAQVGYVEQAKVCVVEPQYDGKWRAKVFLAFADGYAVRRFPNRTAAEGWCTETVQKWFDQLKDK